MEEGALTFCVIAVESFHVFCSLWVPWHWCRGLHGHITSLDQGDNTVKSAQQRVRGCWGWLCWQRLEKASPPRLLSPCTPSCPDYQRPPENSSPDRKGKGRGKTPSLTGHIVTVSWMLFWVETQKGILLGVFSNVKILCTTGARSVQLF